MSRLLHEVPFTSLSRPVNYAHLLSSTLYKAPWVLPHRLRQILDLKNKQSYNGNLTPSRAPTLQGAVGGPSVFVFQSENTQPV